MLGAIKWITYDFNYDQRYNYEITTYSAIEQQ